MAMSDQAQPDSRLLAPYLLFLAGLVFACAGLFWGAGVAIAGAVCLVLAALLAWTVRRGALRGDWRASHATWLIRMFWVIVVFGVIGWYGRYWFFGGPLLIALWLWAFWRIGKGLLRWRAARAIERPESWF